MHPCLNSIVYYWYRLYFKLNFTLTFLRNFLFLNTNGLKSRKVKIDLKIKFLGLIRVAVNYERWAISTKCLNLYVNHQPHNNNMIYDTIIIIHYKILVNK